jgi:uncharacterized membrane protein YbhN (UPF0104 family)
MSALLRRSLIGVALGVVVYAIAIVWFDVEQVSAALQAFNWWVFPLALLASSLNYLLRFAKWELCLGWLDVRGDAPGDAPGLTRRRSLLIYLAGLSMSVSPGKLGEVLRSLLLKASDGVAIARTAPIVVADRATDLIALVLLSLIGVSEYREMLPWVLATITLVALGILVLGSPKLFGSLMKLGARLPAIGGVFVKADAMVDASERLLRLSRLLPLTLLSVLGWGLECVGYWVILNAFGAVEASLQLCAFAWAATTIVGALTFLPGGLGATELSLGALVPRIALGASAAMAVASTLLIRVATLWFGVVVGGLCLAVFMRDPDLRHATQSAGEDEA